MEPLFLQPQFKERIWGGNALETAFGYGIPSQYTGECWAISAHPNGPSTIMNGHFKDTSLATLWHEHPELFGHSNYPEFPLLTKIIDANQDLSVQVHPDDEYGLKNNGELGKTECWYILDCEEDAELILGHNASTKDEFINLIREGNWNNLLRKVPIKPGDFFHVPSGTLHAIGKGTLVLETQQSSDTTYRVYDFDRVDDQGMKRELHLHQAIDVTTIPHQDALPKRWISQQGPSLVTRLVDSPYFSVYKWDVSESYEGHILDHYMLVSIISGEGSLLHEGKEYPVQKGNHFILPSGSGHFQLKGQMEIIASHE
ncbi:mannose-6-phosphate isomerase, class I [Rossellomorea aquimaris]|uniref:mannose-6-phosphate isomerase, class I n=1 Tax=Rossellomorea aquimaris TaxID=189382 RepID=UPI001CD51537|nr:mannose-6-phosphate isomerase, class I [Rossellomorea aquimaris]MCA1057614.1 mannose-6-phosphate isomerase, class I [Rossellomorea aquimaris]